MPIRNKLIIFSTLALVVTGLNAQGINQELFPALHSYRNNPAALNSLHAVAFHRSDAMRDLIATDPAAALVAAIPADVRRDLPSAVRDLIEEQVSLDGELEVSIEDGVGFSRVNYHLLA